MRKIFTLAHVFTYTYFTSVRKTTMTTESFTAIASFPLNRCLYSFRYYYIYIYSLLNLLSSIRLVYIYWKFCWQQHAVHTQDAMSLPLSYSPFVNYFHLQPRKFFLAGAMTCSKLVWRLYAVYIVYTSLLFFIFFPENTSPQIERVNIDSSKNFYDLWNCSGLFYMVLNPFT